MNKLSPCENPNLHQTQVAIFPTLSLKHFVNLLIIHILWSSGDGPTKTSVMATQCTKQHPYSVEYFSIYMFNTRVKPNRTVGCDMKFQWTVAEYCCYDKHDRNFKTPFCCYSETYKVIFIVGFVCFLVVASTLLIFLCGFYEIPHYALLFLTCGTFNLNNWLIPNPNNEHMSYFSDEPFWSKRAKPLPYPLRPMPARIFYPRNTLKFKSQGLTKDSVNTPLFVVASRQFTRKPYSARPPDPVIPATRLTKYLESGKCWPGDNGSLVQYQKGCSNLSTNMFGINVTEHQATEELLEALRVLENNDATLGWDLMTESPDGMKSEINAEFDVTPTIPGSISCISLRNEFLEQIPERSSPLNTNALPEVTMNV